MSKFREWLYSFLPYEIKDEYITKYKSLEKKNEALEQEIRELRAYIDGMHAVLRRRVYIKNEVNANEKHNKS